MTFSPSLSDDFWCSRLCPIYLYHLFALCLQCSATGTWLKRVRGGWPTGFSHCGRRIRCQCQWTTVLNLHDWRFWKFELLFFFVLGLLQQPNPLLMFSCSASCTHAFTAEWKILGLHSKNWTRPPEYCFLFLMGGGMLAIQGMTVVLICRASISWFGWTLSREESLDSRMSINVVGCTLELNIWCC
jgi:hypothetical protein